MKKIDEMTISEDSEELDSLKDEFEKLGQGSFEGGIAENQLEDYTQKL